MIPKSCWSVFMNHSSVIAVAFVRSRAAKVWANELPSNTALPVPGAFVALSADEAAPATVKVLPLADESAPRLPGSKRQYATVPAFVSPQVRHNITTGHVMDNANHCLAR